jgi:multidrug efflux pump
MLCAKILRVPKEHGPVFKIFERGFNGLAALYARSLRWVLAHRAVTLVAAIVSVLLAVVIFTNLKREFVPPEDRGMFITVLIAPEGSTLGFTDQYQRQVEAILAKTKDVDRYFSVVGGFTGSPSRGFVFTRLTDKGPRRTVQQVIAEVQGQYFGIPGVMVFANNPPAFGGFGQPVQFVVRHPDFTKLAQVMDTLTMRARQIKGLRNVDTDLRVNKPELTVSFDRDRAEDLGVGVGDVAATMQTLLGGRRVSTFTQNNKLYDVIVQLDPAERATPNDVAGLYVSGRNGQLVQLSAVTTVKEGVGPQRLNHFDRVRSFTLTAGLTPGFTLGEALDSLNRVAKELLPPVASTRLAGESRELAESGTALYFAFGLALLVVFMVLASQFESLIHPLTVLVAVPLAITGALVTLYLTKSTINLYSQIGMILLIGLVTKNSILLVEYANQLMERGNSARDAILEAGRIRLRPILMTSVSTIMGAMPIALGLGAGATSRRPLGYAIGGGVFFSTVLTLYLVPTVWLFFEGVRKHKEHPQPAVAAVPVMAGEAE